MSWFYPADWYVHPVRVSGGGRDNRGYPVPEVRSDLPRALLGPGASEEEGLLSEVTSHRGRLLFEHHVELDSTDRIEVRVNSEKQTWKVAGRPNHWPQGTEVTVERS